MTTTNRVFSDTRENLRINENKRIAWRIPQTSKSGRARVRNISTSGMLLEIDEALDQTNKCVLSFDTDLGPRNFIPQTARLVWQRKQGVFQQRNLCGVKFVEPSEYISAKLRQRIQKGLLSFSNKKKLTALLGVLLIFAAAMLAAWMTWTGQDTYKNINLANHKLFAVSDQQAALTMSYSHRYYASELMVTNLTSELESTKQLYNESESMLVSLNEELESTKSILAETEQMLAQAKSGNTSLVNDLETVKNLNEHQISETRMELEQTISLLQQKNKELNLEISVLQDQMRFYAGDVKNTEEAKVLMNLYEGRMRTVKTKIKHFKKEAQQARKSALKELDRIRLVLGNNGYLVKNGVEIKVNQAKYDAGVPQESEVKPQTDIAKPRNVTIDVEIID